MKRTLRVLEIPFKAKYRFTIEKLDFLLARGDSCILLYVPPNGKVIHAVFIDKASGGKVRVWNRWKGEADPWFDRACVARDIARKSIWNPTAIAFVLKRDTPHKK